MSQQPEAEKLAYDLDTEYCQGRITNHTGRKAATELRRLHFIEVELRAQVERLQAGSGEAVACVSGYFGGRCQIDVLDRSTILPAGMALYSRPAPSPAPVAQAAGQVAAPAMVRMTDAEDLDAWKCERCNGDGWHWQMAQVGERESDQQEVKTDCDECECLGWLGPDAERAARSVGGSKAGGAE